MSYSQWMTPDAIVIYPSWKRFLMPMLICAAFVAGGLFLSRSADAEDHMTGILCIVVFGIPILYPLARLVRRTPTLIIHSSGIFDNGSALSVGFLLWDEISSVNIVGIRGQRYLAIEVKDKDAYLRRQSGFKVFVLKLNSKLSSTATYISAMNLSMPLEEIIANIREKRRASRLS